jgi:hypothetical protein
MGKSNRQRRAAKARERARNRARDQRWDPGSRAGADHVEVTLHAAIEARLAGDQSRTQRLTGHLAGADRATLSRHAGAALRRVLHVLWDAGWQPREVVRQARRVTARAARLVAAATLADHASRKRETLHPDWASQVDAISDADADARAVAGRPNWLQALADRLGLGGEDLAVACVEALGAVVDLGPLPIIVPPPGATHAAGAASHATRAAATDDPVLAKVRALLAQAESTTYEAEASAFTAKAQALMARHAIDAAFVWERAGRDERPVTIRLPIDEPYLDAKSMLLDVVAERSRCRAVRLDRYALCSVVGFASDVAATEVLFTSLLLQSQVALRAHGAVAGPGMRARSRAFRSSFLFAYAQRIDERLAAINEAVENAADARTGRHDDGRSLLPVLAARSDAVDDALHELFPNLVTAPVSGGRDAVGRALGRSAADRAQLSPDLERSARSA